MARGEVHGVFMLPILWRERPLLFTLVLIGVVLSGLLIGFEPVGGDPDRVYRPIKSELARALDEWRLPFWSNRFGLGVPLVAESHVAAFYPPNLGLYGLLNVSTAYRLSMWIHYLALAATTYFYARSLELDPWGSALAAIAFALCGFQAIHSSHEWSYHAIAYLPLALGIAERFMVTGRSIWLAALPLTLGLQWTVGHFQIQMWTSGLVVLTGIWRAVIDRWPWRRAVGVLLATGWGAAVAAVQLGPSWQFANLVGQTQRPVGDLVFYSFPPLHWFELALPRLIRELRLGPEDPYWFTQQTTGYEAALYVGTIPLIFALVACLTRPVKRFTLLWLVLVPVSFAMATMPRWWPQGYLYLVALPGLGYFRAPARYTLLTGLGLAILAGEGFNHARIKVPFRLYLGVPLLFAVAAATAALFWTARADVNLRSTIGGIADGFLWAALAWSIALVVVLGWRSERFRSWVPVAAAAIELGILYYAGTTQWGRPIALPEQSPVLNELARLSPVGLVAGELGNLPVRADLKTGYPYLGFLLPPPVDLLSRLQEPLVQSELGISAGSPDAEMFKRWLRRFRVSYLVGHRRAWLALGTELSRWRDPALDRTVYHTPEDAMTRTWSIVRLDAPFPEARVVSRCRTAPDRRTLVERLSRWDDRDVAWFLAEDHVPDHPDARSAQLVTWDGSVATVEHDGPCDLVIARTFDPGWLVRIENGSEQPVVPVDGGFQAVRLDGSGIHRVHVRYQPPRLKLWIAITLIATALDIALVLLGLRKTRAAKQEMTG